MVGTLCWDENKYLKRDKKIIETGLLLTLKQQFVKVFCTSILVSVWQILYLRILRTTFSTTFASLILLSSVSFHGLLVLSFGSVGLFLVLLFPVVPDYGPPLDQADMLTASHSLRN